MISYTLKCKNDHSFDSWFQSAEAFDKLHSAKLVTCAICGVADVEKSIMAPRVSTARSKEVVNPNEPGPLSGPATAADQAFAELRKQVEDNSENVGKNFASEARAIHDGDAPARAIYGEAKVEDAKSLIEDGIKIAPLPFMKKSKTN